MSLDIFLRLFSSSGTEKSHCPAGDGRRAVRETSGASQLRPKNHLTLLAYRLVGYESGSDW